MIRALVLAVALAVAAPAHAHAAGVPRFGHVWVVMGENTSYEEITGARAPYLVHTLKPRGAWLTNYHTFTQSESLGQYIAMLSGQFNDCEAHNALPAGCHQGVPNLLAQLAAKGRSWRVWEESMPDPCHREDSGSPDQHNEYSAHHNPGPYFTNLRSSCASRDLPMGGTGSRDTSDFDAALAAGRAGRLNIVVPNDCENGHDACGGDPVRHFDDFLAREVPQIESSPAFGSDGVIVVVWDEGADPPHDPGHVAAAVVGPRVRAGAVDRARHDHYGLERTLALGFGLRPLAHARTASAITSIWR